MPVGFTSQLLSKKKESKKHRHLKVLFRDQSIETRPHWSRDSQATPYQKYVRILFGNSLPYKGKTREVQ